MMYCNISFLYVCSTDIITISYVQNKNVNITDQWMWGYKFRNQFNDYDTTLHDNSLLELFTNSFTKSCHCDHVAITRSGEKNSTASVKITQNYRLMENSVISKNKCFLTQPITYRQAIVKVTVMP